MRDDTRATRWTTGNAQLLKLSNHALNRYPRDVKAARRRTKHFSPPEPIAIIAPRSRVFIVSCRPKNGSLLV